MSLGVSRYFLNKRPLRLKHACRTLGLNGDKTARNNAPNYTTILCRWRRHLWVQTWSIPPMLQDTGYDLNNLCPATTLARVDFRGHLPLQKLASNENLTALRLNGLHPSYNLGCDVGSPTNRQTKLAPRAFGSLKELSDTVGMGGERKRYLYLPKDVSRILLGEVP